MWCALHLAFEIHRRKRGSLEYAAFRMEAGLFLDMLAVASLLLGFAVAIHFGLTWGWLPLLVAWAVCSLATGLMTLGFVMRLEPMAAVVVEGLASMIAILATFGYAAAVFL